MQIFNLFVLLLSLLFFVQSSPAASSPPAGEVQKAPGAKAVEDKNPDNAQYLIKGKSCLDKADYDSAVSLLTASLEKLPILGDYALLWRAKAYEGKGDQDKAIEDLRTIREKYQDSPLLKRVRLREVELLKKKKDSSLLKLYEGLVRDYPSNMDLKYAYAMLLKGRNEVAQAKALFKEIYLSPVQRLAAGAFNELSPDEITVEDLIKRGKNFNAAWHFKEAEKNFREALSKAANNSKDDVLDGLAYSLFRQKRYTEAAELYKQINNSYWRARSVFRAGDMDTFEAELQGLYNSGDKRVAPVLLAYGMKKRREGNTEEALKIFNNTLAQYPSAKEEALWDIGWTYYLSRDYKSASNALSQLAATYGDSKYLYWSNKCKERLGKTEHTKVSLDGGNGNDFYTYLSSIKNSLKLPVVEKRHLKVSLSAVPAERIAILDRLGLRKEAASELLHLSRKNPAPGDLVSISSYLKKLGNYKMSIRLIARIPYSEELHDLYYPLGYWAEVEDAAKKRGIDPYLVLSVMREESRFAPDARSIAGAMGLMQLMPQTAARYNRQLQVDLKRRDALYDAKTNILIGSCYLKQLLNRLGSIPLALAAYNGGEEAVNEWVKKGNYLSVDEFIEDIPYDETRNYVKKVMTSYFEYMRTNTDPGVTLDRKYLGDF